VIIFCYINFMLQNKVKIKSIWNYFITLFMMTKHYVLLRCFRYSPTNVMEAVHMCKVPHCEAIGSVTHSLWYILSA
jgi:hypothetical protein